MSKPITWKLLPPRARRLGDQIYVASIVVEGTELAENPQFIVMSQSPLYLKQIVDEHNQLVTLKEEKTKSSKT